ncbi:MAG: bifunctional hydroxymethylpyrimidine kinase/phosphomethylpyrimidine kinase [Actinomycetota bacterium]|nr:bifunctional hydroxymethylpyrimidine kinase/phosphomethylpyrimidine kinase [Actinomycetota bacterium]
MRQSGRIPAVLTIAGSDSGGGAGIQADLKAFAACGVHGTSAITAITAQNTVGVTAVHVVPAETIVEQVRAVASDIGVDAVKIGMLGDEATIEAVARALHQLAAATPVVLDPVMVAESGAELLVPAARALLVKVLLPRATVITPNLPEARALFAASAAGHRRDAPAGVDDDPDGAHALARALHALGPKVVVVTGGHRLRASDVFFDGERLVEIPGARYASRAAHGSGCTHSSVLAARLALGDDPLRAARAAKRLAARAVRDGLEGIGRGAGPVNVLGVGGRVEEGVAQVPGPDGRSTAARDIV